MVTPANRVLQHPSKTDRATLAQVIDQPKLPRRWLAVASLGASSPGLDIRLDDELTALPSAIDIMIAKDHRHLAPPHSSSTFRLTGRG